MSENQFQSKIVNIIDQKYNSPIIIGGFIDQTTLGVTTTSYIIQEFNLHEVAMLKSRSIPPVTVFVGGKLRSPFRIYSNKEGTLMVIQCEVPVNIEGLYEITEVIMQWLKSINPRELAVIDGVPVQDIPDKREAFLVASPERIGELKKTKLHTAEAALISGMGGAILNESIFSNVKTIALLSHVSTEIPDPDAVLAIIKALNSIYDLSVQTTVLEESVKEIHENISKITQEYKNFKETKDLSKDQDSMYR